MVYSFQEYYRNDSQLKKYTELSENPDALNNSVISFPSVILSVDRMNQTILAAIKADSMTFPPVEISTGTINIQTFQKGDRIDVIGVVHEKRHIIASSLRVIEPWELALVYVRSLLAIPFVLYLFFTTWTLNTTIWCFDRRKKDA